METNFERLEQGKVLLGFSAITFIKQDDADPRLIEAVYGRVSKAKIVDVSDQEVAAEQLEELLNIRSQP